MFAALLLVILSIIIPVVYPSRASLYVGLACINSGILYAGLIRTSLTAAGATGIIAFVTAALLCTSVLYHIFFKTISRL